MTNETGPLTEGSITCPTCEGYGNVPVLGVHTPYGSVVCGRCEGVGVIPEIMKQCIDRGKLIRESRIRRRATMGEEAEYHGISVSAYCAIERGLVFNLSVPIR